MNINGIVESKSSREYNGKFFWNVKVDNVSYGFGAFEPKCNKGDNVSFEATQNEKGYWNANSKTLKLIGNSPQAAINAPAPTRTSAWVPDDKRQDSINYQSARKDALTLVEIAVSAGALEFGAKAKAGDKYDVIKALVDKLTVSFFNDTKNLTPSTPLKATVSEPANGEEFSDQIPF